MNLSRSIILMCIAALGWCTPSIAQEKSDAKAREDQPAPKKERVEPKDGGEGKRPASEDKADGIKQRIEDLRRAGKNEEADKLQQQLTKAGKGGDKRGEVARDGAEQFKHVQEAIEHLRAAGLKDQAQNLEQLAKNMRAELEKKQADSPKGESGGKDGHDQVQNLRRELDETREQMKQMMQELREVRALVQKNTEREGRK